MKKLIQLTIIIGIMLLSNLISNAQVSTALNTSLNSTHFVGWNSSVTFPLNIRHNATNQPINFYTGGSTPAFQRMTILGGSGINSGRVGINTTGPARRLTVADNARQFRLTRTGSFARFVDFEASVAGDLLLNPSGPGAFGTVGKVGINLSPSNPPTRELDVFGRVRVRTLAPLGKPSGIVTYFSDGTLQSSTGATGQILTWVMGAPTWVLPSLRICTGGIQSNFVPKWTGTEFCQSIIYDDVTKVGIGTNFTTPPQSLLHQHVPTATFNYHQFTNSTTGAAATNGFKLGIAASSGTAELRQQENAEMHFFTDKIQRVIITTNNGLGHPGSVSGDGIRIVRNPVLSSIGNLDLWTGQQNTTHIKWDESGLIQGELSEFQIIGLRNALRLDARRGTYTYTNPEIIFNITPTLSSSSQVEVGRFAYDGDGDGNFDGNFGVHTATPVNTLEINSDVPSSTLNLTNASAPTRSGLRFNDLNSTLTVDGTGNGKVLSVNEDGDVILVEDQTGGAGGTDYDWKRDNYNLPVLPNDFLEKIYHEGQVAVGINSYMIGNVPTGSTLSGLQTQFNAFVDDFRITGNFENLFQGDYGIGLRGFAGNINAKAIFTCGVLGEVDNNKNPNAWGGYFVGKLGTTTNILSPSIGVPSDLILKKNIQPFSGSIDIIKNINPITFQYNGKAMYDSIDHFVGVNAQDILPIAPYAVDTFHLLLESTDTVTSPILAVNTNAILYTAINALKDLDSTDSEIKSDIHRIDSTLSTLTGGGSSGWSGAGTGEMYVTSATDNVTIGAINSGNSKFYVTNNTKETTGNFESYGTGGTGTLTGLRGYAAGPGRSIAILGELAKGTDGFAGYFKGNVLSEGDIAANRFSTISDSRYKTNVQSITYALDKVEQLQGIRYEWDTVTYPDKNFKPGTYLGFIGQDVETVIPEVVSINDSGFYSLDYDRIVPLHNEAIKELNHKIDSLQNSITDKDSVIYVIESRLSYMENCLANHPGFCGNAKMGGNSTSNTQTPETPNIIQVNISSENLVILFQNEPNPFNEQTTIRYFISENINNAEMVFYDEFGRELQRVAITEKGYGQIDASTTNLAAGIYTYSILTEGKVADTKKMLRSR